MPLSAITLRADRAGRAAKRAGLGVGPHPVLARLLVGCWLALHVLVVGAAPLVDALGGHGQEVVAHWEDSSDDRCPPRHDEVGCQLAQVIAGAGIEPGAVAPLPVVWRLVDAVRPAVAGRPADDAQRTLPSPRGPPAA